MQFDEERPIQRHAQQFDLDVKLGSGQKGVRLQAPEPLANANCMQKGLPRFCVRARPEKVLFLVLPQHLREGCALQREWRAGVRGVDRHIRASDPQHPAVSRADEKRNTGTVRLEVCGIGW